MPVSKESLDPYFGKLDQAQKGVDNPAGANSVDIKKFDTHPITGGEPVGKQKTKYASSDKNNTRKNGEGEEVLKKLKETNVPKADDPTTASAAPGKDLAQIISQVDPGGAAQVFPNMIRQFAMIKSVMNVAAGGGGRSAVPTSSQTIVLSDAFSEALCILCNTTSFSEVMVALDHLLINNGISRIDAGYQTIVRNGITNLIQKALIFGENNIPVKPTPIVVYGTKIPPTNLILPDIFSVSDLAVKQYYTYSSDPYPGYITYINNNQTYSYVKRREIDYPYENVDDECLSMAERGIAYDLFAYVYTKTILAPHIFSDILIKHKVGHEENAMHYTIGKNSNTNLMSNLSAILGIAGIIINLAQGSFLGKTILGGEVSQALNAFSKNLSMAKTMAGMASSALKSPSSGAGIAGISAIAGILSNAGIPMPNIASAVGGNSVLSEILAARGTIAGIAYAVASVSSLNNQLNNSGSSVSQLNSTALGQTTPSLAAILNAMKFAGITIASINAAEAVLRDIGLV
jgi:hypothetical protein